jgi:hypothetical protein
MAALLLLSTGARAQSSPAAHVAIATSSVALDDASTSALFVPVTLDPGWRLTGATVVAVGFGTRRDANLVGAITAIKPTDESFYLDAERDKLRSPGNYEVTVQLQVTGPAAANSAPQAATARANITVTRAPPEVDTPSSVIVDVTDDLAFPKTRSTPVTVTETTHTTKLSDLAFRQVGTAFRDGRAANGTVKMSLPKDDGGVVAVLLPGGSSVATVEAKGFDLGNTTGTLSFSANELSRPIEIPYVVSVHRWSGWVFLLFVAGGVAGFLVRQVATNAQRHATLCQQGDERIRAMRVLVGRSLPPDRDRLIEAIETIRKAASEDDDKLAAAIESSAQPMKDIVASHRGALDADSLRLKGLMRIEPLSNLLAPFNNLAATLKPALDAAAAAVGEGNVAGAEEALAAAEQAVAATLTAAGPNLNDLVDETTALMHAIPRGPAELDPLSPKAEGAHQTAAALRRPPEAGELPEALVQLDRSALELRDALVTAARDLAMLATDADAKLVRGRRLAADIAQAARVDLSSGLVAAVRSVAIAVEAIRSLVAAPIDRLGDAAKTAKEALMERDYRRSLEALDLLLQPPQGGAPPQVERLRVEAKQAVPSGQPRTPPVHEDPIAVAPLADSSVMERSKCAGRIQRCLTFLIIPLSAYLGYPSFVGTKLEIFGILAAAFMTDFTFDTALAALNRAKKA